ncbi:MAG: sigma-70 family RNA polymerase sigma factor [Thermoanaerobaculales bacterium]
MGTLEQLMREVAAGDDGALGALYDSTSRRVFGLVLSILRDHHAAQEVTLDVYTRVWQQARRFDASRGSAEAWLLTLAHNQAIDRQRSLRRRINRELPLEAEFDLPDPQPDPEAVSCDADQAMRVRRALRSIPEEQRRAIVAAYFDGLSHTEVAEALGQPLGTVKTRIRSGLLALRRALIASGDVQP